MTLATTNRADVVGEIITDATLSALNAALADRGVDADRIISILPVTGQSMISVTEPKFRVLYRTH